MNKIKERLKELRTEKNLKQSQVAEEFKIPEATYSNWEQGRSEPSIDSIIMLCKFFNVSAGYLIGTED